MSQTIRESVKAALDGKDAALAGVASDLLAMRHHPGALETIIEKVNNILNDADNSTLSATLVPDAAPEPAKAPEPPPKADAPKAVAAQTTGHDNKPTDAQKPVGDAKAVAAATTRANGR